MSEPNELSVRRLIDACIAKRGDYSAMKALEVALAACEEGNALNHFWALMGIAADSKAEAAEAVRARDRAEGLLKDFVMKSGNQNININSSNTNVGQIGSNSVANSAVSGSVGGSAAMQHCAAKIEQSSSTEDAKDLLRQLHQLMSEVVAKETDVDLKGQVERDLAGVVAEATAPHPRPSWYKLSGEGLVAAAERVLGLGSKAAALIASIAKYIPVLAAYFA